MKFLWRLTTLASLGCCLALSPNAEAAEVSPTAKARDHWAFKPPSRPLAPRVRDPEWPRQQLDQFVLARLETEEISPSPEADRATLIRRLTFDLTGMPPAPEEVEAFLADGNPDAYERLVDRLLASPDYGERLALEWLDGARYADTYGYHEDWPREMWAWRDWVINAFNRNTPFDQFTVEQLAGDLLPNATQAQQIATGFNRLHGVTASGHPDEFRTRQIIDRITTTSTVWMALTVSCSQCHDHKYDPISQREFYEFYAFFNTIGDPPVMGNGQGNLVPLVSMPSPEQEAELAATEKTIARVEKELNDRALAVGPPGEDWQRRLLAEFEKISVFHDAIAGYSQDDVVAPAVTKTGSSGDVGGGRSDAGAPRKVGDGETHVDLGDAADFDRDDPFSFAAWIYPTKADGPLLARVDPKNSGRGYDIVLDRRRVALHLTHEWPKSAMQVVTRLLVGLNQWSHVCVTYDGSSASSGVKFYLDGQLQTMIEVTHDNLSGTIKTDEPLYIGLRKPDEFYTGGIDDLRIYDRALTEKEAQSLADQAARILKIPSNRRTDEERTRLRQYHLANHDEEYKKLATGLAEIRKKKAKIEKSVPTTMVMRDMEHPRRTHFLKRGLWNQPGEEVHAGIPAILPPLPEGVKADRLGLARWLVDKTHPLTRRVVVNRYWQMLFGIGIVETTEDFGTQGEPPSHPLLLDFLATEFSDVGWDLKAMLRQMVTSSTYRQSSKMSPGLLARDPDNRLLARGPRFRLAAETIRDNALAISGLLVGTKGGPSVRPYQPPGLWKEATNRPYKQDHGEKLYRRSLYTYWRRSVPPPNMVALDATNREVCVVRRQRTNTPLAALVMMNDPAFVEAARVLAQRVVTEASPDPEGIAELAFLLATARRPNAAERDVLLGVYRQQLDTYRKNEQSAQELIAVGESKRDERVDPSEHAAWTSVCTLILNLDETMTKE
jgi:hypothetical protein